MQVLGIETKSRLTRQSAFSLLLILLFCSVYAQADYGRIMLRKGPGSAFPVVFEVSAKHHLRALRTQGEWVLLADERKQGWAKSESLSPSSRVTESQLWHIKEQHQPSVWSLQGGVSSLQSYSLAISRPWRNYSLSTRFQRAASGDSSWQNLEFAAETDLKRFSSSVIRGSVGIGAGFNEAGNSHWSETQEELTTAVGSLSFDWQTAINTDLKFFVRIRSDQAFSGNKKNHNSVALMWDLRL